MSRNSSDRDPTTLPVGPSDQPWTPSVNPWIIAGAVMLATFMEVLDGSVANVALPHIAGSLSAGLDEATWVLTSYLVSNAIILPATGWLSSFFGRKRLLIICIVIFTLSSITAGAAMSLGMLVFARIVQGAGGGALQPISQAVLLESFPPHKRGRAMAAFGMGVVVAPIIGPTLGGWITDYYSWRWVFYINVPIGILAILLIHAFLEDPPYVRKRAPGRIDYYGFGLMALWIGVLQIMLDKGEEADWFAANWMRWFAVISVVGFVTFIIREMRAKSPIVDLRVLKNRNFAVGVAMMGLVGGVLYSTTAMIPLFLQDLLGYPPLQSGLAVSPRGIGSFLTILVIGRIVDAVDNRLLIAIGFVILALSVFALGGINLNIGMANVIWPLVFNGVAMGFIFVPLTTVTMGLLENEQMGNAAGIFNLMRNIGGSFGISAAATMVTRGAQIHQAALVSHLTPYDAVFQQRLRAAQQALTPQLGAGAAHTAYGAVYGMLVKQAAVLSYIDNFRTFAFLCLLCVPCAYFFKKVRKHGAGPPVH
ncbi:MAG TPA: DHA2 family efflux MFS transporter permease subunit [Blastocatellia bacterium]|nr:DHA2 family efflux MFS transporter permease subunit [Blastocatellia bacterium]